MKIDWKNCFKVGISVFLIYIAIHYWKSFSEVLSGFIGSLFPLVVGAIIAYVVNLSLKGYEKIFFPKSKKKIVAKLRRPVCMLGAYLSIAAIITVIVILVLPQLISCIKLLISTVPDVMKNVIKLIEKIDYIPKDILKALKSIDWESWISKIFGVVSSGFGSVVGTLIVTVTKVFSGVVSAFLGIVFSIYLLLDKERICKKCHLILSRTLPQKHCKKVLYVQGVLHDSFSKYIVGQCTEAVILGVLCMLGMLILRIPYESMVGALIAFTALIPVVGAFIGAGIGAVMILTVDPVKALIFIIFIIVLQQLEGNFIYPKVVGTSLGLPALLVLSAVTVGGSIMGVFGMLLAVPLTAAAWKIINDLLQKPALKPQEE